MAEGRKDSQADHTPPDAKMLEQAGELEVQNAEGVQTAFKTLYAPKDSTKQHLIVFIRHFFCGHCEHYTRALSTDPLLTSNPNLSLTIIGCGQPVTIHDYIKRTDCVFPIYCDPDRRLYNALGLVSNLELGDKRPEYIKSGVFGGTMSSMWNIFSSGAKGFKGGAYSQNGGEFVFRDGECCWAHRMQNTRDHAEIAELKEALGLEGEGK